jgi:hypothetical protein
MKAIYVLLCFIVTKVNSLNAQKKFIGNYYDYFGSRIEIYSDSTYNYSFRFDLGSSWTMGKWKANKDTLYFTMIPIYDTLVYKDSSRTILTDSLILSTDRNPEKITSLENIAGYLSSGGQNRHPSPDKLFYKRNKLFLIVNGKLSRDKIKGFWTQKKYVPCYIKETRKKD